MNITVYCASAMGDDPAYQQAAEEVGEWIARSGHRLVYGGGKAGLMGVVADTVLKNGGQVTGVIPEFLVERELLHSSLTEAVIANSMSERRDKMIELGDAFITLPGGTGTLDEIGEIAALTRLGRISKPCIIYDVNGFYQPLMELFENMIRAGFLRKEERSRILVVQNVQEIEKFIKFSDTESYAL